MTPRYLTLAALLMGTALRGQVECFAGVPHMAQAQACPRCAVITGGTKGIGYGIAQALGQDGYSLFLTYKGDEANAKRARDDLKSSLGVPVELVQADLSDAESSDACVASLRSLLSSAQEGEGGEAGETDAASPLHVLVHNAGEYMAGVQQQGPLSAPDLDMYDRYQSLYPKAFVRLVEGLGTLMPDGRGRIVVISAQGIEKASAKLSSSYLLPGQAKSTMSHLAKMYATAMLPRRITVNLVVPGFTDTPAARQGRDTPEEWQKLDEYVAKSSPSGGWVQPSDIGTVVSFLVSDGAALVTGAVVPVDGGLHLSF